MGHRNLVASLLTGASLAALSLVSGRSALGATLTGTGTTVIAANTDFVLIEVPADYDLVVNEAIISDGFDDLIPGQALAVWITTDAAVDHFVNDNVIRAIEGTAPGPDPTGNNATTALATATGMRVNGDVPEITNNGLIEAIAVAHDTEVGSATASAFAKGLVYDVTDNGGGGTVELQLDNNGDIKARADASANSAGPLAMALASATGVEQRAEANGGGGTANVKLDNEGNIIARADAEAFALNRADVDVNARGVQQSAEANDGGGVATTWLDNDGKIEAYGYGLADSTSSAATADVFAVGVEQEGRADGSGGTATATLVNDGVIEADAQGSAFALGGANASVFARGVDQDPDVGVGGTGTATLDNDGKILANADALAVSTSGAADASAGAFGADQDPDALDGDVATATVNNDGELNAYAHASAFALSAATARVRVQGVANQDADAFGTAVDNLAADTVYNTGSIEAKGYALADSTSNNAMATATVTGISQDADAFNGNDTARDTVTNEGSIEVHGQASAFALLTANAKAAVIGIDQDPDADNGTATAAVDNDGELIVKAYSLADSTSNAATAQATATGVRQTPDRLDSIGTATATVNNPGALTVYATASAYALDKADVSATARGVQQSAEANDGGGVATTWLDNDGKIEAYGYGLADSTSSAATADVFAVGVEQEGRADGSGGTATATLVNDGVIEADAQGSAFALGGANASVFARGVDQDPDVGVGGTGTATLDNDGKILANADALAVSTSGAADASAGAFGADQDPDALDGDVATATVNNDGELNAYAHASAFALSAATARVRVQGVANQDADAFGTAVDNLAADTVYNTGSIEAKGYALADSTSNNAMATATVTGISQDADAFNGNDTARDTVTNEGSIEVHGQASAFALLTANAKAAVIGIDQDPDADNGTATAAVDNDGELIVKAYSLADSTSNAATAQATATGVRQTPDLLDSSGIATARVENSGAVKVFANASAEGATATARARAVGIFADAGAGGGTFDVDIDNSGVVVAAARAAASGPAPSVNAFATGILVTGTGDGSAVITNDGGTIWAGWSNGGAFNRGNAINLAGVPALGIAPVPVPALIELKGNNGPGHIHGDIVLNEDDRIEVTEGKTYFDGIVYSPAYGADHLGVGAANNSLDIFDGGNLVLCQEGWSGACDPGGWANAGPEGNGFDPQQGANGPSYVFVDTFTVQPSGTVTFQLTPNNTPGAPTGGDYPQVYAARANLAGTVNATYLPGFYANQTTYEDVIAANVRNGTFDAVTDNSVLLKTTALYDGNTVDLEATRVAFDEVSGLSSKNQTSVGGAIEKVYGKLPGPGVNPATQGPFAQLVANLFTIDNVTDYKLMLDQLAGAQYAQYLQSVLWSLRALDQSITDRMDCSLNGVSAAAIAGAPYGCFTPYQWQTWVRGWGGWNNNDGDINAPGYSEDQFGIWVGADYAINSRWFAGVAGGYFDSNMDFDRWGGVSGGSIDYDGGQIALYGGWDNAVWYDRAIVKFGWYSGDSHRNFAFRTRELDPSGSPDADVVDFYNELGRRFAIGGDSVLTPFFGITVAQAEIDGFTERDPHDTGAALRVSNSEGDSLATALGLRYNGTFGAFKPQLAVAWEHEFEDSFQTVNVSFASAPSGAKFKVIGTDLDEDSLVVEAGGAYALGASSDISVRYVGRWLSDYDTQSVMGRFTYKFGVAPAPTPEPLKLGGE